MGEHSHHNEQQLTRRAMLAVGEPVITKELYYTDVARMSLSAIRAVLSLLYDSEYQNQYLRDTTK